MSTTLTVLTYVPDTELKRFRLTLEFSDGILHLLFFQKKSIFCFLIRDSKLATLGTTIYLFFCFILDCIYLNLSYMIVHLREGLGSIVNQEREE